MKKAVSLMLALMIFVLSFSSAVTSYSATKPYAEDKLVEVQRKKGFIPGKTAKITGNCFGFISAVCENLHGIKYDGEGIYGNYKAKHLTGNYYTVATYETKSTTMTKSIAKNIRDFFIDNAQPGDVVHYGAYTTGTGNYSTHTIMIQHIDRDKMQIYHSNYETRLDERNDCHVDTIVWKSFVENPTQTVYNSDDTVYSFNAMFYLKMKSSGLGITINRLTDYKKKYSMVNNSLPAEQAPPAEEEAAPKAPSKVKGLKTTTVTSTSIGIKWSRVENADSYYIHIKNETKGTTFDKTVSEAETTLNNFTEDNIYTIKVRAINSVGKGKYSDPITVTAKSSTPKVKKLARTASTTTTISYSWREVENATKYYLVIKNLTKGGDYDKTVTTNSATIQGLTEGNVYSVKVRAYTPQGGWGPYSSTLSAPSRPARVSGLSLTSPEATKIKLRWSAIEGSATGYQVYFSTDKSYKKNVVKKTVSKPTATSCSKKGFKKGKTYYVKIRAFVKVDNEKYYGQWSKTKSVKCK